MTHIKTLSSCVTALALGMIAPHATLAETPNIQTKGEIIYLADNLQEEAKLGWCLDTDGRELTDLMHAHSCKPTGNDVLFAYAADTGMISSATYDNKCVAHNAPDNAVNPFGLIDCDATAENQKFAYDEASMEMRLGADTAQCLTVSPVIDNAGPFQSRDLILAACESLEPSFKQWVIQK